MFPYEVKVLENRYMKSGIRFLRLQYPEEFTYEPGQFITLGIKLEDDSILRRSYSIASAPHEDHIIELGIKEVPNGQFTSHLKDFPEGSTFLSTPAMGKFDFPHDVEVVFIAAGIGITPIRGLLQYAYEQKRQNDMMLLFGIRNMDSFLFQNDFEKFALELNLNILPVVSKDDTYDGLHGHVQDHISQEIIPYLKNRENARFFICGMRELASECREILVTSGIAKEHIHIEAFS